MRTLDDVVPCLLEKEKASVKVGAKELARTVGKVLYVLTDCSQTKSADHGLAIRTEFASHRPDFPECRLPDQLQ